MIASHDSFKRNNQKAARSRWINVRWLANIHPSLTQLVCWFLKVGLPAAGMTGGAQTPDTCPPSRQGCSGVPGEQSGARTETVIHIFSYYMHLFQRNKFRHTYLCDYQHIPIKLTNY